MASGASLTDILMSQNSTLPASPGAENACHSDRSWFERHPSRCYRARPFIAGEIPKELHRLSPRDTSCWTLILRLAEGVRARVIIHVPDGLVPLDTEEAIRALYSMTLAGNGFVSAPKKYLRLVDPLAPFVRDAYRTRNATAGALS
jgi:hypothetical protein